MRGFLAPAVLVFAVLGALHLVAAYRLQAFFLHNWTWSELLIHYEGGLVKRGLFGQLAYLMDPLLSARYFATGVVTACYLAVVAILVFELRLADSFAGLLFLFSPGGMLFPVYDHEAYGRKDVFVVLALALSALLVNRMKDRTWCFVLILAVYTVVGLMIEVAWFSFPFAIALYLHRRESMPGWRPAVLVAVAALYAAGWLGATYFMSQGADPEQAVQTWLAIYPKADADVLRLAHCCLDYKLQDALSQGATIARDDALRTGFLLAAGLSALPLLALVRDRWAALAALRPLVWLVLLAGVAGALAPLALAADWGRYIYLGLLFAFVTMAGLIPAGGGQMRHRLMSAGVVIAFYALSWQMLHFQLPGQSPLQPGPLLRWLAPAAPA